MYADFPAFFKDFVTGITEFFPVTPYIARLNGIGTPGAASGARFARRQAGPVQQRPLVSQRSFSTTAEARPNTSRAFVFYGWPAWYISGPWVYG